MLLLSCPLGCEDLLEQELLGLAAEANVAATLTDFRRAPGAVVVGERSALPVAPAESVQSNAPSAEELRLALTACLHSRLASRVSWVVGRFACTDADALYRGTRRLPWAELLAPSATLAIDCPRGEGALHHSQYAAQVAKDGIVDAMRAKLGRRPDIDLRAPDVRVLLLLRRGVAHLAIDFAGEALHRRGYRSDGGKAPLKENLAAAVLLRAGWPAAAAAGAELVDPMCGSGTLLVEGAWMALGVPPAALRQRFGADALPWLPAGLWPSLRQDMQQQAEAAFANATRLRVVGSDVDEAQLMLARAALDRARVGAHVPLRRADVAKLQRPAPQTPGMVVCNPPYGERLAPGTAAVMATYAALGDALRRHPGYSGHVLVGERNLGHALGLRAHRVHSLRNGPLTASLLHFAPTGAGAPAASGGKKASPANNYGAAAAADEVAVQQGAAKAASPGAANEAAAPQAQAQLLPADEAGLTMVQNRLRKNLRRLAGWKNREHVAAFRAYDADLPEYNAAIDVFEDVDGQIHLHVQEYAAPAEVPVGVSERRMRILVRAAMATWSVRPQDVHLKLRRRTQPEDQYGAAGRTPTSSGTSAGSTSGTSPREARRRPHTPDFFAVREAGLTFWVSLDAYIDTGLYLDHRGLRAALRAMAEGRDVLNLFCYTASASVACAAGGARSTTSVDLSKTYLSWAADNLAANGFAAPKHALIHAEVEAWMAQARHKERRYDLIYCGPPTFTNSRRAAQDFDVVRDHERLIDAAVALLRPGGTLVLSSHARRLKLAAEVAERYCVEDWTEATLPVDFARRRPHRTWRIWANDGLTADQRGPTPV